MFPCSARICIIANIGHDIGEQFHESWKHMYCVTGVLSPHKFGARLQNAFN